MIVVHGVKMGNKQSTSLKEWAIKFCFSVLLTSPAVMLATHHHESFVFFVCAFEVRTSAQEIWPSSVFKP